MRWLILNRQYNEHISYVYNKNPDLKNLPFEKQLKEVFIETGFMFAGVYKRNLEKLGHEAFDIPVNNKILMLQWAKENGLRFTPPTNLFYSLERLAKFISYTINSRFIYKDSWFRFLYDVVRKIAKSYKPDIIYVFEDNIFFDDFILELKKYSRAVVAQIGSTLRPPKTAKNYDLILTCMKQKVMELTQHNQKAAFLPLGFDEHILQFLPEKKVPEKKVLFIGSIIGSEHHAPRTRLLEKFVEKKIPLEIMGFFSGPYPKNGILRKVLKKEVWGYNLYKERMNSAICLNMYPAYSKGYATNMAMYETTGVGSVLLTQSASDLHDFFAIDKEVVCFDGVEDAVEKINFLLKNSDYREEIAKNGQKRTLDQHTYRHRTVQLIDIVKNQLGLE